jgi:hypothetical protein
VRVVPTKVAHRWDWARPRRGRSGRRYRPAVRGDTLSPSFRRNSLATRSSLHVGFSCAMRTMRRWTSWGIGGRPGRDVHRQNRRQP